MFNICIIEHHVSSSNNSKYILAAYKNNASFSETRQVISI
jgi:hypothetical protein